MGWRPWVLKNPARCSQMAQCLASVHEALSSSPAPHKPHVVLYACDPSTWEVETGGSEVQGHPLLLSEFEASLEFMRDPVSKKQGEGFGEMTQ